MPIFQFICTKQWELNVLNIDIDSYMHAFCTTYFLNFEINGEMFKSFPKQMFLLTA